MIKWLLLVCTVIAIRCQYKDVEGIHTGTGELRQFANCCWSWVDHSKSLQSIRRIQLHYNLQAEHDLNQAGHQRLRRVQKQRGWGGHQLQHQYVQHHSHQHYTVLQPCALQSVQRAVHPVHDSGHSRLMGVVIRIAKTRLIFSYIVDWASPTLSQFPRSGDPDDIFNLPSSFDLSNPSDYIIWPFISYLRILVGSGVNSEYVILRVHGTRSNLVDMVMESHCCSNLTIEQTTINVLIIKKSSFGTQAVYLEELSYAQLSSFTGLSKPSHFTKNLCMVGVNEYNLQLSSTVKEFRYYFNGDQIGFVVTIDDFYVVYSTICMRMCEDGYVAVNQQCVGCNAVNPDCLSCSGSSCSLYCSDMLLNCHECSNSTTCTACYTGDVVAGGCSSIPGCTQVQQLNTGSSSHQTQCVSCSSDFTLYNGQCICSNFSLYQVSGFCTEVYGCVAAVQVNGTVQCIACNVSRRLVFSQCVCHQGFQLQDAGCVEICGDGKSLLDECDDNNTVDGDGCSSSCVIEDNFECYNRSAAGSSDCVYEAPVTVTLDNIDKVKGENSGELTVVISPAVSTMSLMDFSSLSSFSVDGQFIPFSGWSYVDGRLTFEFDYNRTLQEGSANLTLAFDSQFIECLPTQLTFKVDSKSRELVYYQEGQQSRINLVKVLYLVLNGLVLVTVIVGVFCHSMVGVQTLVTAQLVFLMHFQTDNYTEPLSTLQGLTYCIANLRYFANSNNNLLVGDVYQQLEYDPDNYQLSLGVLLLLLGATLLVVVLLNWFNQFSEKKRRKKSCLSTAVKISNNVARYLALGTLLTVQLTTLDPQKQSYIGVLAPSMVSVMEICLKSVSAFLAVVCVLEGQPYQFNAFQVPPRRQYLVIYLTYLLFAALTFGGELAHSSPTITRLLILSLTTLLILLQFVMIPYRFAFHNLCLFLNCCIVVGVAMLLTLRDHFAVLAATDTELTILTAFIIALLVLIFLSCLRLAHIIYLSYSSGQSHSNEQDLKLDKESKSIQTMISKMNPYKIQSQIHQQYNKQLQTSVHPFQFDGPTNKHDRRKHSDLRRSTFLLRQA